MGMVTLPLNARRGQDSPSREPRVNVVALAMLLGPVLVGVAVTIAVAVGVFACWAGCNPGCNRAFGGPKAAVHHGGEPSEE